LRVSVVTSAHRFDDPRVFGREAVTLVEAGHEVRLFAPGAPNETISGVVLSGPSMPMNRLSRMTTTAFRLSRQGVKNADVVHIHDPELLLLLFLLSFRRKRPQLIYDAHEDYAAQLLEKPWIPRPLRRPISRLLGRAERTVARRCDLVVAATPSIARQFEGCELAIVQNMPRHDLLPAARVRAAGPTFCCLHVGELNERRGANALIHASIALAEEGVVFEQIGPIKPNELARRVAEKFEIRTRMTHTDLLDRLVFADAGLVLFQPGPNHDESQPNKLFEYLALGLPILASDFPHWRRLAESCDALIEFVDPTDEAAVVEGLKRLRKKALNHDRIGQAERSRRRFNWSREAEVLVAAYAQVAERVEVSAARD
jgi:glycosyltransferase involved in cell wall biosynthesis